MSGKKFTMVTDHYSLQYLRIHPNLSKRQARWFDFVSEFDFDIVHRPGKSNVVADPLSRLNTLECGLTASEHHWEKQWQNLIKGYKNDSKTNEMLKNIEDIRDSLYYRMNCIILGKVECNYTFHRVLIGISLYKSAMMQGMLVIWG